jgi:hypothetical protein
VPILLPTQASSHSLLLSQRPAPRADGRSCPFRHRCLPALGCRLECTVRMAATALLLPPLGVSQVRNCCAGWERRRICPILLNVHVLDILVHLSLDRRTPCAASAFVLTAAMLPFARPPGRAPLPFLHPAEPASGGSAFPTTTFPWSSSSRLRRPVPPSLPSRPPPPPRPATLGKPASGGFEDTWLQPAVLVYNDAASQTCQYYSSLFWPCFRYEAVACEPVVGTMFPECLH